MKMPKIESTPGVEASPGTGAFACVPIPYEVGDIVMVRPRRRWWQFWKPRAPEPWVCVDGGKGRVR